MPDYSNLPEKLQKQLVVPTTVATSNVVLDVLRDMGGVASLNDLLIGIYNKTGKVYTRSTVAIYVTRLVKDGKAVRPKAGHVALAAAGQATAEAA